MNEDQDVKDHDAPEGWLLGGRTRIGESPGIFFNRTDPSIPHGVKRDGIKVLYLIITSPVKHKPKIITIDEVEPINSLRVSIDRLYEVIQEAKIPVYILPVSTQDEDKRSDKNNS